MVEQGSQIFLAEEDDDYDLDLLLSAFAEAPQPVSDTDSPVSVTSDPILPPHSDPAASLGHLERFLMSDEVQDGEGNENEERLFFDGLFVDDLVAAGNETETGSDRAKTRDDGAASDGKGEVDKERDSDDGRASTEKGDVDKESDSHDDPTTKKIKRQLRNRDSAKSSRERKKQYIKELEMKSRYLESECKRLNYSLQCFMSENMALRQSMAAGNGKSGPQSGDVAMRESAVLLSESQQSGSLHCLVSIMWSLLFSLLFLPFPLRATLPTSPRREAVPTLLPGESVPAPKDPKREIDSDRLYLLRRRCKESRYQMRCSDANLSWLSVHRDVSV